LVNFGPLTIKL